jgi:hypothetical protein
MATATDPGDGCRARERMVCGREMSLHATADCAVRSVTWKVDLTGAPPQRTWRVPHRGQRTSSCTRTGVRTCCLRPCADRGWQKRDEVRCHQSYDGALWSTKRVRHGHRRIVKLYSEGRGVDLQLDMLGCYSSATSAMQSQIPFDPSIAEGLPSHLFAANLAPSAVLPASRTVKQANRSVYWYFQIRCVVLPQGFGAWDRRDMWGHSLVSDLAHGL